MRVTSSALAPLSWCLELMDWNKSKNETIAEFENSPTVKNAFIALLRLEFSKWTRWDLI